MRLKGIVFSRRYEKLCARIHSARPDGRHILNEAWNHLIVLDACRYDSFRKVSGLFPGRLEKRVSAATETRTWLKRNFPGRCGDIVYVSANPNVSRIPVNGFDGATRFHEVVQSHDRIDTDSTVFPEDIAADALRAADRWPDKRLIVHFIQPHDPYIRDGEITLAQPWWKWAGGEVSIDTMKRLYYESLQEAAEAVRQMINELRGRIVITSDHGEAFGEHLGVYGHPRDVFVPELYEVPWMVIEK